MTPLEAMAKAYWENRGCQPWHKLPDSMKRDEMQDMRAALLGLAASDLPTMMKGAGAVEIAGIRSEHGDGRHLWEADAAFKAMLRAIASPEGEVGGMSEDIGKQEPCGECPAGTYAVGAIGEGIELFGECHDRKASLAAAPRCVRRPNQICMGCRDFIVAANRHGVPDLRGL